VLLELHGHRVAVAYDAEAALRLAAADPPDVVVVEPFVRGSDGWAFVRSLRSRAPGKPAVVAVTVLGRPEDRRQSAEAGVAAHLLKPADPAELLALLGRLG
jgi:DNA-binding response OmpR family regulator